VALSNCVDVGMSKMNNVSCYLILFLLTTADLSAYVDCCCQLFAYIL
jgi:hypothetical protein